MLSCECKCPHAAGVVVYNFFEGGIHLAKTAPLHIHTLPVTFGLSAFVFAGHAVFPSIYRSMKDRSQYPRMLDYTYAIVGLVCVLIGESPYVQLCGLRVWPSLLCTVIPLGAPPPGCCAVTVNALFPPFKKILWVWQGL